MNGEQTVTETARAMPGRNGRQVAGLILAECERAGLGAGARLPTERQLAADLGVTRSGIRHALAALEAEGLISREVGRGTFLRGIPPARRAPEADGPAVPTATVFAPEGLVPGVELSIEVTSRVP